MGNVIEAELPLFIPDPELEPDFMKAMEAVELLKGSNETPSGSKGLAESKDRPSEIKESPSETEDPGPESKEPASGIDNSPSESLDQAAEHKDPPVTSDDPAATSHDAFVEIEKKEGTAKKQTDQT